VTDTPDKPTFQSELLLTCETLLIAAAGGAALGLVGFPAGWLSGSIIAVSVVGLAGRPVRIPEPLARLSYVVMGISLGGAVTPETLAGMARWPLSLAILLLAMIALTGAVTVYLRAVHGWDRATALLASFPGALATSLVLAVEYRADVRAVAVAQTTRVAGLAIMLPAGLAAFGFTGEPMARTSAALLADPLAFALLVGGSSLAAVAAQWLRLPGGLIFGAMISSAVLHGSGSVTAGLPGWLSIASFIVLGANTGARFGNTDVRTLRHMGVAALGAFMVGNVVALGFAALAAWLLELSAGGVMLGYAPGAIDAMMILALALHLDPAFVGAHHLARFIMVLLSMPILVRLIVRPQQSTDGKPGGNEPRGD